MTQHSVYSFSGSHRWMACPASIRMSQGYPNTTNEAAELGTAVHELGEFCIKLGVSPETTIGLTFNGFEVTKKMADDAGLYRNVVSDLSLQYGVPALLEKRVTMTSLGRSDVYGTSDCTHIALAHRTLHTTDYKNGFGVVEVDDNSQTAGYSVATLDTFDLWDKVDKVVNTIVQPNYGHIDGPVRTIVYTMDEMREWQRRYSDAVRAADDPNSKPVAGEHCHYCPAQANCRARMERVLKMAYTEVPLEQVSVGELEAIYAEKKSIEKYLEAVAGRVLSEARNGVLFKEFKLVESFSRATCEDEKGLIEEARKRGIDPLQLYLDPRLVGKTKAAELLPKDVVNRFYRTPPVSSTVVPLNDKRPALRVGKASGIFAPIEQPRPSAAGVFTVIN